jgi:cell division protein FtsB
MTTTSTAALASIDDLPRIAPRRRHNPWLRRALVFVTLVVLADALFGDRGLAQALRARQDHRQAVAELSTLRGENAALRDEARRLRDDPATIEGVAREELGLIRPGEILVVVRDARR